MLHLDFETRSSKDISECGTWAYAEDSTTEILMLAWAFNEDPVQLWQPRLGPMPKELRDGLENELESLAAWYSPFERLHLWFKLGIYTSISRWVDPAIQAKMMSMPGKLERVGQILNIEAKKITDFFIRDVNMVQLFSVPLRIGGELTLFGIEPTTFRDWDTHPREWQAFCDYCIRDVEAEREIMHHMRKFPVPDQEYYWWEISEQINDRGVYTDSALLQGATLIVEKEQAALKKEFTTLTGVKNPKSTQQVLAWARSHGYTFQSLGKAFVKRGLAGECKLDSEGEKGLKLRLQISKSSVSKLESCKNSVASDGRVHHLFNFMGASRTGRYSSGLFQAHNLIKSTKEVDKKFDLALSLLKAGDYDGVKANFSSPLDVACSALRPILIPKPGHKFIIADLSAIESRGAAWVSECPSLTAVFANGLDPYISFAVQMDGIRTYEELWAEYKSGNKETRTNAKPPTLGCMGADTIVVTNNGNKKIVDVLPEDLLWDGEEWVKHSGVLYQGEKEVIKLNGVLLTQDHNILTEEGWREAWDVVHSIQLEKQAIGLATGLLSKAI